MFGTAQRVFAWAMVAVLVAAVALGWSASPAAARQLEPSAQPPAASPPVPGLPRPELQRRMEQVVAAGAPGIVALVDDASDEGDSGPRHEARPWLDARGVADVRTRRPMRPHHRFRVASVTKSFVATVALQLVDEGRLSLTDTVERWLPGVLPYGDRVTLRQVLNHTSGVPDYVLVPLSELYQGVRLRSWAPRELVAIIAGEAPLFPSGSTFSYSNTNYVLAGLMIEQATGHRLAREVRRRILRPLRLRGTSFPVNFPWIAGRYARGHSLDLDDELRPIEGPLLDVTVYNPSAVWAAGNMVSDIDDIARFYRALLGGRLLSPARLAEMKDTVDAPTLGVRYGLGLIVIDTPCGPLFGHTGGVPGFANYAFSSEDGTRQFGLMMNAEIAPAAVYEPFALTVQQAVREAFAGDDCAGPAARANAQPALRDSDLRETLSRLSEARDLTADATAQEARAGVRR